MDDALILTIIAMCMIYLICCYIWYVVAFLLVTVISYCLYVYAKAAFLAIRKVFIKVG